MGLMGKENCFRHFNIQATRILESTWKKRVNWEIRPFSLHYLSGNGRFPIFQFTKWLILSPRRQMSNGTVLAGLLCILLATPLK